jgi:DNA-binding XRE family transcriptional regulator
MKKLLPSPPTFFNYKILRDIRRKFGLSQREMAALLGMTRGGYAGYENGLTAPSLWMFRKMCNTFSLGFVEVFGLMKLYPPGLSFQEYSAFIRACKAEQLTPAHVLADFMRVYGSDS